MEKQQRLSGSGSKPMEKRSSDKAVFRKGSIPKRLS
jgi:hypothetical protein